MDSETRELAVQCMRLVARLRNSEWSGLRTLRCSPPQFATLAKAAKDGNGDYPESVPILVNQSDLVTPGVVLCIGSDGQVLGVLKLA
jgi:hypothetical protein